MRAQPAGLTSPARPATSAAAPAASAHPSTSAAGPARPTSLGRLVAAWLLPSLLSVATVAAGDWPQILGEQRNGIAPSEKLAESWAATGPRGLWNRPIGSGFSGVAVATGRVFIFDRQEDQERVTAVAADTGKQLWQNSFKANFVPAYVNDNGPRCVPTVHGNRVVVFGAQGGLHCLDVKTGKTVWSHDTMALFNSKRSFRGEPPEGYFGKGSSPVVLDGLVIVNAGGAEKIAGVVAFLASSDASFMTGQAVTIDGGQIACQDNQRFMEITRLGN